LIGIFVQPSSVRKLSPDPQASPERERKFRPINYPMPDTSMISSRVDSGLRRDSSVEGRSIEQFQVNDRVSLPKNRYGTVRYVGPTPLGPGKTIRFQQQKKIDFNLQEFGVELNWMCPMVYMMVV